MACSSCTKKHHGAGHACIACTATSPPLAPRAVDGEREQLAGGALEGSNGAAALDRVLAETSVPFRSAAAAEGGVTRFVARAEEMAALRAEWQATRLRGLRAVLLVGEAGIGKSRCVHAFEEAIASEPFSLLELQCAPGAEASAFYPVLRTLRAKLAGPDGATVSRARLEAALVAAGLDVREQLPLLGPLLSARLGSGDVALPNVSALKLRERTMAGLLALLLPPSAQEPRVLVLEDLHWADASTLELVERALAERGATPALLVMTSRPEREVSFAQHERVRRLALSRLLPSESCALALEIVGASGTSPEVLELILDESEGIPLSVEEYARLVRDRHALAPSGAGAAGRDEQHSGIPVSVQALLGARLDSLGEAKFVAQVAATIGREFGYELLRQVTACEPSLLDLHLERLARAGLVLRADAAGHKAFSFRHALIRDAAYATLFCAARRRYHESIAHALVEQHEDVVETRPELVAQHYELASLQELSLPYWEAAGQRALAASAYREASQHLRRALAVIEAIGEHDGTRARELDLRASLGVALIATEGYGAPGVMQSFERAEELNRSVGLRGASSSDLRKHLVGTWGLSRYRLVRCELDAAQRLADQLRALATLMECPGLLIEARLCDGVIALIRGEHARARRELEAVVADYDIEREREHGAVFGQDPKQVALAYLLWSLYVVGQHAQARQCLAEGLEHARRRGHAVSEAFFCACAAHLSYMFGERERCEQVAEETLSISSQQGTPVWQAAAGMYRGWARAARGLSTAGLREVERHLGLFEALQISVFRPTRFDILSRAQELNGDIRAALASVDKGIQGARATGERWYLPELERRRGELALRLGQPGEARRSFERALELARAQGARSFEQRAQACLSRVVSSASLRASAPARP